MKRTALEFTNALNVLRGADRESGKRSHLFDIIEHVIELERKDNRIWFSDEDRDWLNTMAPARRWELSGSSMTQNHFVADRWQIEGEESPDDFPRVRAERQAIWLFLQYLSIRLDPLSSKKSAGRIGRCDYCGEYFIATRSDKRYCSDAHRAKGTRARSG